MALRRYALFVWIVGASLLPTRLYAEFNVHPLHLSQQRQSDVSFVLERDHQGFLWVATDNGLKRYDGYKFHHFAHEDGQIGSISGNEMTSLLVASDERLWAGGRKLNLYDRDTETFQTFDISRRGRILSLYEGSGGDIWLGGEGFGLLRFNTKNQTVSEEYWLDENDHILEISARATDDTLWLLANNAIYEFDPEDSRVRKVLEDKRLHFFAIEQNKMGRVWLATNHGLFEVVETEKGELALSRSTDFSFHYNLKSLHLDKRQRLWIGTENHGVYRIDINNTGFLHLPSAVNATHTFPVSAIVDIFEDDEGVVWFAASEYGVYRVAEEYETFQILKHISGVEQSLAANNIKDLAEDSLGNIWIATQGKGLDWFNPKQYRFQHFNRSTEKIDDDNIVSLELASDQQRLWIGTRDAGLYSANVHTQEIRKEEIDLPYGPITEIHADGSDYILIGVESYGLVVFNLNNLSLNTLRADYRQEKSALRNTKINKILTHVEGSLYWIGGDEGLELFNLPAKQSTPVYLRDIDFDEKIKVNDILQAEDDSLWLATSAGLIHYSAQTGSSLVLTKSAGLEESYVSSITVDAREFLWLGTRKGVSRFNPEVRDFLNFQRNDGLASALHNNGASLLAEDGRLYLAGVDGISVFNPDRLLSNENAPAVHLTEFSLYQQTVKVVKHSLLEKSIVQTREIELDYDQRDITIEFTALNYIFPENNEYRYRLKGLESSWLPADSQSRKVRYTNLDPGHYVFQVLAANNDGVWTGSPRELVITVHPAWWQTLAARIAFVLLCVLVAFAFMHWRIYLSRKQERILKGIVDTQTYELKKANQAALMLNAELEQRVAHRTRELSREIEERRVSEAKAQHLAFHDALTGLPNRAWQLQHLQSLLELRREGIGEFSILFIGGDRFKQINDNYGHVLGDKLLIAAAQRLLDFLDDNSHASRLGSDEFAITLEGRYSEKTLNNFARNIILEFEKPFELDDVKLHFYVSIGMLVVNQDYSDASQILRNANIALRKAKEGGRGTCKMFDSEILEDTLERSALEEALRQALKRDQFSVVLQPIIALADDSLQSFEVLLRWRHPIRGMVGPDKFIPIAEAIGAIFDIGAWVLEQACLQLVNWKNQLGWEATPNIAVNLSAIQISEANFLEQALEIVERSGADTRKIKFEITETAIMEHTEAVEAILDGLRASGFELAIDDFGTGYSSLSYLDRLPVQYLKIDRAFVAALTDEKTEESGAHEIVRATISLAHSLGMRVVGEGIENRDQKMALKRYGCDFIQGYMISKPLAPEDATAFLLDSLKTE